MLDIRIVRENPQIIKDMLRKRNMDFPLDRLIQQDKRKRILITKAQELKHKRNVVAGEIASLKERNLDASDKIHVMKEISERIERTDTQIRQLDEEVRTLMLRLPNMPHESVPVGKDESENVLVRSYGRQTEFTIQPKDHIDIGLDLDIIDIGRASKVSGARFYFLKGDIVRLNYALIEFALDFIKERGYTLIQPPYLLRRKALEGNIILSDFEDVIYKVEDEDLYLIATSEHALASMHKDEVLEGSKLPIRYGGVSPCFRKEAGSHGRDTKGIFRVHQFEKVEQFVFSKPEDSSIELERMITNAEDFFMLLGIPYEVRQLCTGDLSKVSAKSYDLEGWLPGQGKYREMVSSSNCTDYQSRTMNIKYRDKPHEEAKLVHTLNSTLVATERALIAILENQQQSDETILIPKPLQPYMGGTEFIEGLKGRTT